MAIDYGAAYTRAVLVWPGGACTMLPFDGSGELSSAVHVSQEGLLAGAAAWLRAPAEPDGFVLSPLRAGTDVVRAGGVDVPVADLAAQTLRHVAAEAMRVAGTAVADVRLVVPAGWGPRRRMWLRQAAGMAELRVSRVVAAPVAAAPQLQAEPPRPGQVVLVIDVGAGSEVSVLLKDTIGWEVLSQLADPGAGADHLDVALHAAVTGSSLDDLPGERRWPALAAVRAAKHALSQHPAVTMPSQDGHPPVVITSSLLHEVTQPQAERIAQLAGDALGNADRTLDSLDAVYVIGAGATPAMAGLIGEKLGAVPTVAQQPAAAAVLGAAEAPADALQSELSATAVVPPLRRLTSLALPALASLALFAHFVFSADFNNGTPDYRRPGYYVLASWGELAMSSTLAVITFLQAATLIAVIRDKQTTPSAGQRPARDRLPAALLVAVAGGLATSGMYALVSAVYMAVPASRLLRWALLPAVPTVLAAAVLVAATWRTARAPTDSWDRFLTFPPSSVLAAVLGIMGVALFWSGDLPAWLNGWGDALGIAGGALIGVAIACALVQHWLFRVGLAVMLGLFLMIISRKGPELPAILYTFAVAAWWSQQAWAALRLPSSAHGA